MIKTDTMIKLKNRTIYFPKVILEKEELINLYVYGHALPSFLREICINVELVDEVINEYSKKRLSKQCGFDYLITKWLGCASLESDLLLFSTGDLDLIDLSVKYGFYYYDLKKAFIKLLPNIDVEAYWKKHKMFVQKKTCMKLYGVDSATKVPSIYQKQKDTMLKRYGVDNSMKSTISKNKLKDTMLRKYGVTTNLLLRDACFSFSQKVYNILNKDDAWGNILATLAKSENIDISNLYKTVPVHRRDFVLSSAITNSIERLFELWKTTYKTEIVYPTNIFFNIPMTFNSTFLYNLIKKGLLVSSIDLNEYKSKYEQRVGLFLDSLGIDYERNVRIKLDGLEMDFYVPSKKIGIEINPNSSHNSNLYAKTRVIYGTQKDKNYHYMKYKIAKEKGITLINLYEFDLEPLQFENKTCHFLKQKICGFDFKIYGRNTVVYEANKKIRKRCIEFLDKYHLQGASTAETYLAMEYNNEIVGVASFVSHKDYIELKRLCFKYNHQVIGGLSKFIRYYFKTHIDVNTIMSYSDNNIGDGESYRKAGGEFVREFKTSLRFISHLNGLDNYSWQIATKWGAEKGVLSKYSSNLETQDEINEFIEKELPHRYDNGKGYDRVYTCGSKLWKFSR